MVCDSVKAFNDTGLSADVVWNGGFCKYNQVGVFLNAVVHHADGLVDDIVEALLAPLGALFNAWLHKGYRRVAFAFGSIEGLRFCFRKNDAALNEQQNENGYGNRQDGNRFFDVLHFAKRLCHGLVRCDNKNCVAEDADIGEHLQKFKAVSENVTQVAPRECEITVGAGHFEACVKHREKNQQNGADFGRSVFSERVDKTCQGVIGAEEGNEQKKPEENQSRWSGLYVHHVVNPVVVNGVVEHARPEGRKHGLPAAESVQDDKPRNKNQ